MCSVVPNWGNFDPRGTSGHVWRLFWFYQLWPLETLNLPTWLTLYFCCIRVSCSVVSGSWWPHGLHPPGSSVHGILWARILEWVVISFSRGIFPTQGSNPGLLHCRRILYHLRYHWCWTLISAVASRAQGCCSTSYKCTRQPIQGRIIQSNIHEAAVEKSRIHFTSICMALWFPISVNRLPSFVQIMMAADVAGANPPSKLAAWSFWHVPLTCWVLLLFGIRQSNSSCTFTATGLESISISPVSFASFLRAENGT